MTALDPKIGRFLFDTITKGLYDNPLCVFREYIQNAADAIDKAIISEEITPEEAKINIEIDPTPPQPKIIFEDNGSGLSTDDAEKVLSSVGETTKFGQRNRGFRGIGRLGGMAYCNEIFFRTKARGESKDTINRWNCRKMAEMLNPNNQNYRGLDLQEVIRQCASFEIVPSQRNQKEGFFKVEMHGVQCARNILIDVVEVRKYLSQVAPVPFDYQNFPFGKEIDNQLRKEVLNYNTDKVLVNFEEVFKPYKITVRLSKNKTDVITGIVPLEILDNSGKIIGRGWRAEREELLGAILRSDGVDGIRVRVGNILIGDNDLLDKVFSQERFNAYFIGEIHAVDPGLIPNSRRDDFEDSEIREIFYDKIKDSLGEPLSKIVQKRSSENAKIKVINKSKEAYVNIKEDKKIGFVSDSHRSGAIKDLRSYKDELFSLTKSRILDTKARGEAESNIQKIDDLLSEINQDKETIICSLSSAYSHAEKELIGRVFNHLYNNYSKAKDPVKLTKLIVQKLNAERKK